MAVAYDVVVVGGGVEGSATAYHLAKDGRRTLLLEQVGYSQCFPPSPPMTTEHLPQHCPMHDGLRGDMARNLRGLTFTWWRCYSLCLWHKPTELAHSFWFCSCICFCLHGPFNCISFHKFSGQLSVFSTLFFRSYLCLIGSPNIILCGWLGSKHHLTN